MTLMPMVHIATGGFYANTVRSPRLNLFDAVFHEGSPPGCTEDSSAPTRRFLAQPAGDGSRWQPPSLVALLLEGSYLLFIHPALSVSRSICQLVRWEPLQLQPLPICPPPGCGPRFVSTDNVDMGETVVAMFSLGWCDPRADRLLRELLGHADNLSSAVVPWGAAHMPYFERKLRDAGFVEAEAIQHLTWPWGTAICAHLLVWAWWWTLHMLLDVWLLWRTEGRLVVCLPFFSFFGATLHLGSASDRAPSTKASSADDATDR